MELTLNRQKLNDSETIGQLGYGGSFECYTLEDRDRFLTSEMTLQEIKLAKVYGATAIPTGRYEIVISYSNRFKRLLPLLVGVKGFEGIRIHPGNTHEDTDGCILLGEIKTPNSVLKSRSAFSKFMLKLTSTMKKEKVYITIDRPQVSL